MLAQAELHQLVCRVCEYTFIFNCTNTSCCHMKLYIFSILCPTWFCHVSFYCRPCVNLSISRREKKDWKYEAARQVALNMVFPKGKKSTEFSHSLKSNFGCKMWTEEEQKGKQGLEWLFSGCFASLKLWMTQNIHHTGFLLSSSYLGFNIPHLNFLAPYAPPHSCLPHPWMFDSSGQSKASKELFGFF